MGVRAEIVQVESDWLVLLRSDSEFFLENIPILSAKKLAVTPQNPCAIPVPLELFPL